MDVFTRSYIPQQMASVKLIISGLLLLIASVASAQTITGTVFRDFNSNGLRDGIATGVAAGEVGVPSITVVAFNTANSQVASTTTNVAGSYTLTSGAGNFRVEFRGLPTGDFEAFRGTSNSTSIQFVAGGATNVNLGINYPQNYCNTTNPNIITSCYVSGTPTAGTGSGTPDALVGLKHNDVGQPAHNSLAQTSEVGAVWGLAYQRSNRRMFSASFVKRHVGFGPGGIGAIYATTLSTDLQSAGTPTVFYNLGAAAGTASTAHGTLPTSPTLTSDDNEAYTAVGRTGLGDIDISDDESQLYVVNLQDRRLYVIPTTSPTAANVTSFAIPNPCTVSSTTATPSYRPFAVKYYRGKVYVGVVCTREELNLDANNDGLPDTYAATSGLQATVYEFNGSTFTQVLSFPLTYQKGATNADQTGQARAEYWRPWSSTYQTDRSGTVVSYPEAWLTDIEFDVNGDMLLGIRDRFGDQIGWNNRIPLSSDNTSLIRGITPGEILRAGRCNGATTWSIEQDGSVCGSTASTLQSSASGPGTGKYYWGDRVQDGGNHMISSQGGLGLFPGSGKVIMSATDPTEIFDTGGLKRLINATGAKDGNTTGTAANPNGGIVLYTGSDISTFGKANGVGDVEILCPLPPIQIGNRVWFDSDNDGVQDAGEPSLAGVQVTLKGPGLPTAGVSVTTNSAGEYYFANVASTTASPTGTGYLYSLTALTPGGAYSLTFPTSYSTNTISLKPNAATGVNADAIDTDASAAGIITFVLGDAGENDFSFDVAYITATPDLSVTKTATNGTVTRNTNNTYQVVVTNTGSLSATNVVLTDILGAGQTFVGSTPAPTTTSGSTRTYSIGTLAINASATISITVTAINEGVLTNSVSVTATENESGTLAQNNSANATFAVPVYLCAGETFNVTLPASFSNVQWFQNGTLVASGNSYVITQAGSYSYSATNLTCTAGCTLSAINGAQQPLTITPSSPAICPGGSTGLTVNGCTNGTLLWSTGQTTASITVSPVSTTAYSVTCTPTSTSLCPSTTTVTVTVNPSATGTLTGATICTGVSAVLTATGGVSYALVNTGATSPTGQFTVTPTATTIYTVVVTNVTGCTALASSTVTVNSLPTPTLSSTAICVGQTATITATSGTSYTLLNTNTVNNTGVFTVTPGTSTTYTVRVSNGSGCTAIATGTVTVNSLPAPTLSSTAICAGQTASLTATGGTSYTLVNTNAVTASVFQVTPTGTTSYTIRAANANGCTALATGTVTVNALPSPIINSPTICAGQSTTLVATGGGTYNFGNGPDPNNTFVISPATTTIYNVTVVNGSGCIAVVSSTVTVNTLPTAALSSTAICVGQTATITATGGTSYTLLNTNTVNNTGVFTVTPGASTTYTVRVSNGSGCTALATSTVTVNALPTPAVSSTAICAGQTATITATGGTSYTLLNTNTVNNTGVFTVTPGASTTYTVRVSNGSGCTATATGTVTVNSLPTATLNNATICNGQSATLTATGGTSYQFAGSTNNTGLLVVSPSTTTTYTVVVTNANSCTATATGTVTVNPVPVISVTPSNPVVCLGSSANLTVNNCTGSVRWSTNETTTSITVTPLTTTTYSVTCTTPQSCTVATQSIVTVSTPGSVSVSNNSPVCPGATINLAASGSGSVYFWSGPNSFTANTANVSIPNASAANAGLYSVTVSGGLCSGTATTNVSLNPAVVANLSGGVICAGQSVTLVATGGTSYQFLPGNITNITGRLEVSPSATSNYSVIVTNAQGCTGIATTTVTVNPLPTPTLSNAVICVGQTATITATGGNSYTLLNTNTVDNTGIFSVTPGTTTIYTVRVSNATGCTATTTGTVTVNQLPTPTLSSTVICSGQTATLTATGGVSYTLLNTSEVNNTGVFSVNPTGSTSYTVRVSNANSCVATATGTITVNSLPTPALNNAVICAGQSAILTATGGTAGSVYNFGNGNSSDNTLSVSPNATTTYSVTVTNAAGCIASASGIVTVNPLPTPTLSSAVICTGQTATITATGGDSFTLLNTNTVNLTGVFSVNPTATTVYTVRVSDGNGCVATTTGTVTVNTLPTPTLSSTAICIGANATITATGGTSYTLLNTNSVSADGLFTVNPTSTTTYTVVAGNGAGCLASATGVVTVNELPTPALSSAVICAGQTATITTTGGSSYTLLNSNEVNTSGVFTVNPAGTTSYTVRVSNASGCVATATGTITVNALPTPALSSTVICVGQTATITATGGSSYTLLNTNTVNTSGVFSVAPASTTSYTILVSNGSGCTATALGTVTVNPLPVATLSSVTSCAGQSVQLNASGGSAGETFSYTFSTGLINTTGFLTVSPTTTTTYSVIVGNANGCSTTATGTVTVNPALVIASTSRTICAGQTVDLTALIPGYANLQTPTFRVGSPAGATEPNPASVTPSANTLYYLTAQNSSGCSGTALVSITVNPLPFANPATQVVCANGAGQGTFNLTALTNTVTGGVNNTVAYFTDLAFTNSIASPSAYLSTSGDVYVRVTNPTTGCSNTAVVTLVANLIPEATLNSSTICAGQSVTLTATGGTVYNFGTGNTAINTLVVNPASTTSYSVIVTNGAGCSALATGTVTVNSVPAATLSSAVICAGVSATLTTTGGTVGEAYTLTPGSFTNTTGQFVVNPSTTTNYTVLVSNVNGCTATATGTVTVNPVPAATLSSAVICAGQSATLTSSGGTLFNFGSGNSTNGVLIVTPSATTSYSVLVTNATGCTAVATGTVTVNPRPTPTVNSFTICAGQSATLIATGGSSYNFGNGPDANNTLVVSPNATTTYSVTVSSGAGCSATATGTVTVNSLPVATLSSAVICVGQSVTLTASGGTFYNFGSGNSATGSLIVNPASTTTYSVIVTNAAGCTALATGTVTVNPVPTATLSSAVICTGFTTILTATGGNSYTLLPGNVVNATGQFTVSPVGTTTYTVIVSNGTACTATATGTVTVNPAPVAAFSSATICNGQSVTLTATGGTSYEFVGNINNTSGLYIANPSTTTTYSVVVTDANGCTAAANGTITVNPLSAITISPANPVVCLGSSVTLTVNSCIGTVRWSTNAVTTSITVTPTATTIYSATCTTPQGCTTSAQAEVVVSQPGSVSINDNSPICSGETLQLSASGSGSVYSWSGPNGFTANTANVSIPNATVANAGLYSVTVAGGLCSGTASTNVTVNPAVNASLSGGVICDGQSVTLVATGGTRYEFLPGNRVNMSGRLVVSPSTSSSFSVIVTNAQGCTGLATTTVTVNPSVTASLSSATICEGQSATITATGGTLYNFGSGNTPGNSLIVNPTTTTSYNVTVTNGSGCVATALGTVQVNPLPTPTLSSTAVCFGQAATITATGGTSYTLLNTNEVNTTGVFTVNTTITTTYTVRAGNGSNCFATATGTVTVNPLPNATLSSAVICVGQSATLTASGGTFYNFGNGASTDNTIVVNPVNTTSYTVVVTVSTATGCTAPAVGTVTVNQLPVVTLSNAVICAGASASLAVSGGTSYTLIPGGQTLTTASGATGSFVVNPSTTTSYTVIASNASSCTASVTGTVTVNQLPVAALTSRSICTGSSTTLVASGGTLYNFGSGNTTDGNLIVTPSATTVYSVTVTDGNNCSAPASGTVTVNPLPIPTLTSSVICSGQSATLTASDGVNLPGTLYNFGNGSTGVNSLIVNPTNTTTYSVIVTNPSGCTALVTSTVTVNPLPTVAITTVTCNGLATYTVNFTATAGAIITASAGTVQGNQVVGVTSGQPVVITATLNGCTAVAQTIQNCQSNAATLGDFVFEDVNGDGQQDAGDLPIPGVTVTLISNGSVVATTTTDVNGLYSFTNLTPGIPYSVSFSTPAGFTATTQQAAGGDTRDSDADPVTGLTRSVTLAPGSTNNNLDAGFYRPASLGDYVFADNNRDGIQNTGDTPLSGVTVTLIGNGTVVATTTTDANGLYSFTGLMPGVPYSLSFATPANFAASTANVGTDPTIDSNPIGGITTPVQLTSGENNTTLDAGFFLLTASLGDYVFEDVNANGQQDAGDLPIANVTVTLVSNGTVVATTLTDVNGLYSFTGLIPGKPYTVSFGTPPGFTATVANSGDDATDSDAVNGVTGVYTLTANQTDLTVDAGFFRPASLGDRVFADNNRDGVDQGEPGIQGVLVTLISNGSVVATTTTDANGLYFFTGLTPGVPYSVSFTTPANYSASTANVGTDDTVDSDPIGGITGPITLTSGQNSTTTDAGFFLLRFDLSLRKVIASAPNPILPGSLITYQIIVSNDGELTATNTQVTDTPPAGLSFAAASSPTFTSNGTSATANIATLSPGQSATLTIGYTLIASTSASLTNRAEITADSGDDINSTPGNANFNPGENDTAGAIIQPQQFATLGNFVWEDTNGNGQQDPTEPGISGVTVSLVQNNSVVATTTTDANGLYSFTGLTPGLPYQVQFGTPSGFLTSVANTGSDASDNDADPTTGLSQAVVLFSGETNNTIDAGFYRPATIGSIVFNDLDRNGQQGAGEPGIAGVTVTLYANGSPVATVITDVNGAYSFTGLVPGTSYTVGFTRPTAFSSTSANQGDDATDSDADPITGITTAITLTSGQSLTTVNAGFYCIPPSVSVVASGVITCINPTATLTITSDLTTDTAYLTTGPGGFISTIVSPTVTVGGTYTVTATNTLNSCSTSTTVVVVQDQNLPNAALFTSGTVCEGNAIQLTAVPNSGVSYLLTGPNGFSTTSATATIGNATAANAGTYTVVVTSLSNGCQITATADLTVRPTPVISLSSNNPVCEGSVLQLTATNIAGATYTLTGPNGLSVNSLSATIANAQPINAGVYAVVATLNGCTSSATVNVGINPLPQLQVGVTTCTPNLLTFSVSVTATGTVTASAGSVSATGGNTYVISGVPSTTMVLIRVTDPATGCFLEGMAVRSCQCPDIAPPTSAGDQTICLGEATPALSVSVGTNQTADWFATPTSMTALATGTLTFTPSATAVGEYTVFAQTRDLLSSCLSASRTPVTLTINPRPGFTLAGVAPTCSGAVSNENGQLILSNLNAGDRYGLTLGATYAGPTTYAGAAALPANGVLLSTLGINNGQPQTIVVRVFNANGCFTDQSITLTFPTCDCPPVKCIPVTIQKTKIVVR